MVIRTSWFGLKHLFWLPLTLLEVFRYFLQNTPFCRQQTWNLEMAQIPVKTIQLWSPHWKLPQLSLNTFSSVTLTDAATQPHRLQLLASVNKHVT